MDKMSTNCILERVEKTQSTNDDLLARWRSGELTCSVARIAYQQTAGKGRAGRSWLAKPEDSLCFSLAYPFKKSVADLSGLSLMAGLAVITGISEALNIDEVTLRRLGLGLKWPNDLLISHAKFGGILIEGGQTNAADLTWMVIGVGLNLRNALQIQEQLQAPVTQAVAALDELTTPQNKTLPEVDVLWLKIIESLERYLSAFEEGGFAQFRDQWMRWDAYQNQAVSISGAGKEPMEGIARGIDESGRLLINKDNQIIAIHAGDVSLRVQS
jgi:BirA family transcriptional regulator, biotin operon repressor / biotin---[acetyl-CoA-carboxylase] ligase